MRALVLVMLLGACAATSPVAATPRAPAPVPAPVALTPRVIIKTKRVIVIERKNAPDVIGPAILRAYATIRPDVDRAVVQSRRPAAIVNLTVLDRRVRHALQPFVRPGHKSTPGEVDAAIDSLTELRAAAAATQK